MAHSILEKLKELSKEEKQGFFVVHFKSGSNINIDEVRDFGDDNFLGVKLEKNNCVEKSYLFNISDVEILEIKK